MRASTRDFLFSEMWDAGQWKIFEVLSEGTLILSDVGTCFSLSIPGSRFTNRFRLVPYSEWQCYTNDVLIFTNEAPGCAVLSLCFSGKMQEAQGTRTELFTKYFPQENRMFTNEKP